jgi:hypothetical protein
MKAWIGLKRDEAYVHEWEGETTEDDIPNAVRNALTEYASKGEVLWGLTILLDRVRPQR